MRKNARCIVYYDLIDPSRSVKVRIAMFRRGEKRALLDSPNLDPRIGVYRTGLVSADFVVSFDLWCLESPSIFAWRLPERHSPHQWTHPLFPGCLV